MGGTSLEFRTDLSTANRGTTHSSVRQTLPPFEFHPSFRQLTSQSSAHISQAPLIAGMTARQLKQVFQQMVLSHCNKKKQKKRRTRTVDASRSEAKYCYQHKSKWLQLDEFITVQFFDVVVVGGSFCDQNYTPCIQLSSNFTNSTRDDTSTTTSLAEMNAAVSSQNHSPMMSTLAIYIRSHPLLNAKSVWGAGSAPQRRMSKIMGKLRYVIEQDRLGTIVDQDQVQVITTVPQGLQQEEHDVTTGGTCSEAGTYHQPHFPHNRAISNMSDDSQSFYTNYHSTRETLTPTARLDDEKSTVMITSPCTP